MLDIEIPYYRLGRKKVKPFQHPSELIVGAIAYLGKASFSDIGCSRLLPMQISTLTPHNTAVSQDICRIFSSE